MWAPPVMASAGKVYGVVVDHSWSAGGCKRRQYSLVGQHRPAGGADASCSTHPTDCSAPLYRPVAVVACVIALPQEALELVARMKQRRAWQSLPPPRSRPSSPIFSSKGR